MREKQRVCVGFVLVDVGSTLLNSIKRIHMNSLAWVRAQRGEQQCFKYDSDDKGGSCPLWFLMYTWME